MQAVSVAVKSRAFEPAVVKVKLFIMLKSSLLNFIFFHVTIECKQSGIAKFNLFVQCFTSHLPVWILLQNKHGEQDFHNVLTIIRVSLIYCQDCVLGNKCVFPTSVDRNSSSSQCVPDNYQIRTDSCVPSSTTSSSPSDSSVCQSDSDCCDPGAICDSRFTSFHFVRNIQVVLIMCAIHLYTTAVDVLNQQPRCA